MITQDAENTNRPLAAILTLVFHGIVVVIFLVIIFHTQIPPYPEVGGGSGLEVNLGNSDNGTGNTQPEQLLPVNTTDISSSSQNNSNDEIITQDNENTTPINSNKNTSKNKNIIKINDPIVNPNALYKKKDKNNEGETGKPGDQGNPAGDYYAKNHYGTPGNGRGIGSGTGTGIGDGTGPGISSHLKDRSWKILPKPKYDSKEQGKVVVTIIVDRNGNVTKAQAGARGTTATQSLWKIAEDAAYKAKFDVKHDAPEEQKGTITYNFINLN